MSDKLKMSALLRLGAKQVKPIRGIFLAPSKTGKVRGACAIGMMAVAKAGTLDHVECERALAGITGPWDKDEPGSETLSEINHRFEQERQSPAQIARWLESEGL